MALLIFVLYRKEKLWFGYLATGFAVLGGVFFAADLFFFQIAIHYVGPGLATILGNCQAFILAIVGVAALKEKLTWQRILAFPIAATGLLLLVGLKWKLFSHQYHLGIIYGIATAFCYGGYVVVLRQAQTRQKELNPLSYMTLICIATSIILGVASYQRHVSLSIPNYHEWIYMLCYGIIGQASAWYLIAVGVPKIPVSFTGFILLTQPALTFIWDVLLFHRTTPMIEWFGVLLTLLAIFISLHSKKESIDNSK